jgi:hypothetical protein
MAMSSEPKIVIKSIEFAKSIIAKLDSDSGQDNLEFVLGQLSPNDVIARPRVGPTGAFVTSLLFVVACLVVCGQLANFRN